MSKENQTFYGDSLGQVWRAPATIVLPPGIGFRVPAPELVARVSPDYVNGGEVVADLMNAGDRVPRLAAAAETAGEVMREAASVLKRSGFPTFAKLVTEAGTVLGREVTIMRDALNGLGKKARSEFAPPQPRQGEPVAAAAPTADAAAERPSAEAEATAMMLETLANFFGRATRG